MQTVFGSDVKSQKSKRAAVILYTFVDDPYNYTRRTTLGSDIQKSENENTSLLFLVGIHAQTGDITDFGGGVKDGESDLMGAYREFHEETRGIFKDEVSIELLETCVTLNKPKSTKTIGSLKTKIFYEGMSAIFVPINNRNILLAPHCFANTESDDKEISKIFWVNENQFEKLLNGKPLETSNKKMWTVLRNFYKEGYTSEFLETLYVRSVWDGNFKNMAE